MSTLFDELEPSQDRDVEQVWIAEAQRRYEAYLRGEIEAHDGDDVMTIARNRLNDSSAQPAKRVTE